MKLLAKELKKNLPPPPKKKIHKELYSENLSKPLEIFKNNFANRQFSSTKRFLHKGRYSTQFHFIKD
jgi:hypothetical protein